jgi:hypothetical protein
MRSPKYSIYIPSKGRSDICLTAQSLAKEGLSFFIVVEPQDYAAYATVWGEARLVRLDKNNGGLSYAQNFIKDYSYRQGEAYHWQLDDDLSYFQVRKEGQNIKATAREIFLEIEDFVGKYENVGAVGPVNNCFAFSKKDPLTINKFVYVFALFNNAAPQKWTDWIPEDSDYSLQILSTFYWCTVNFNRLLFAAPPPQVNRDGMTDQRNSKAKHNRRTLELFCRWPQRFRMRVDGSDLLISSSQARKGFPQQLIPKESNEAK